MLADHGMTIFINSPPSLFSFSWFPSLVLLIPKFEGYHSASSPLGIFSFLGDILSFVNLQRLSLIRFLSSVKIVTIFALFFFGISSA